MLYKKGGHWQNSLFINIILFDKISVRIYEEIGLSDMYLRHLLKLNMKGVGTKTIKPDR